MLKQENKPMSQLAVHYLDSTVAHSVEHLLVTTIR